MTSGEHQKACTSDILFSIKQLMVASSMPVLLILPRYFLPQ